MARNPEKAGFPLRKVLLGLFTIFSIWWICSHQANVVADRALGLAFPDWEIYYGSIGIRPLGGAWISDVDMAPLGGDSEDIYHFDKVTVEIPLFQFYRSAWAYDLLEKMPKIKDVIVHLEGGSGSMTWPFSREMALFGNASASPFEAEGCAEDGSWIAEEFSTMGLDAKPTRLTMAWHRQSDRIIKEQSIETPGVGRVSYRGEILIHDDKSLLSSLGSKEDELSMAEWHVVDEGFVAARNAYCASKDGISETQFIERHLATAQRTLAAVGMRAHVSTLSSYRHFAEQGGSLDLVVHYSPTIDAAVRRDDDWSRWLTRSQGQLSVQGRSNTLSMRSIKERPFPEDERFTSVWQILSSEQAHHDAALAVSTASESTLIATDPTVQATTSTIAVAIDPSGAELPAEEEVLYAEAKPVEERPAIIEDYARLRDEIGQHFLLYAKGKPRMRVEIVGVDNGVVRMRRYLRSGFLEQMISRATFLRAERVR